MLHAYLYATADRQFIGVSNEVGSITVGKRANIIVTRPLANFTMIPYMYQTPFIKHIFLSGKSVCN